MSRWLLHPRLTLLCRLALGATFLVAAWPKLLDPPAFAKAMAAYALMPAWAVHPAALVLPWLEALTGLALVLGLRPRAAAAWLGFLLLTFALALGINLARRHPVDCGCFQVGAPDRSTDARLADMRGALLRDLGLLLLAVQILAAGATRPRRPAP